MSDPNTATAGRVRTRSNARVRALTVTAMLSAISFVLMFLDFSVPLMPPFVKMDISELPALLAAFALGPVYGVVVCLVKNFIHLVTMTTTGGAGELCNFLLGACFVFPAGIIYHKMKSRKGAITGALVGAVVMGVLSIPLNYYISYPDRDLSMPTLCPLTLFWRCTSPSAPPPTACWSASLPSTPPLLW